jgi:response regulator of citrate/malate metabolism
LPESIEALPADARTADAVRYATSQLQLSHRLTDRLIEAIDEPVLAALLLGKTAQASERGVGLTVSIEGPGLVDEDLGHVGRVTGFLVAGVVNNGTETLRYAREHEVDLILLDFNLPDVHGLEVCRALRAGRSDADVIAVTSTRDLAAVRTAVSLGVVQYLLEPFTFSSLRDKLERYGDYRRQMTLARDASAQSEIDRAFSSLRGASAGIMPAGLSEDTLERVARFVRNGPPM